MGLNHKFILILLGIFLISLVSAQVSYCCEKTNSGAWCQNDEKENCNAEFKIAPTSCEATSYCRQGCCYNSQEGNCLKNTPQKICEEGKGVWSSVTNCDIPQCQLGCCLIGDQAAFVTQTRCKKLSSLYGLSISFRKDLGSEISCIASVRSKVLGACVFEKEFERTCLMLTKGRCDDMETKGTNTEFYEGKLCSNSELNTNCGISKKTTCVEGKDEVYFLDSCRNLANIYDSTKADDPNYWAEITEPTCGDVEGNKNSRTCGNCDYFRGSTCRKAEIGESAEVGDYICKDLGCTWEGEDYEHGETWCAQSEGVSTIMYGQSLTDSQIKRILTEQNVPGTRYFRLVCYNGEVTIEPCADYRQEICMQAEINLAGGKKFRYASCVANKWSNCLSQTIEKDCNNTDERDCTWLKEEGICIPLYSPGFSEDVDEDTCSIASNRCIVTYERGTQDMNIFRKTKWEAEKNEQCDPDSAGFANWIERRNMICNAIGDCGMADNYIGTPGFYVADDLVDISGRLKNEGKLQTYLESKK